MEEYAAMALFTGFAVAEGRDKHQKGEQGKADEESQATTPTAACRAPASVTAAHIRRVTKRLASDKYRSTGPLRSPLPAHLQTFTSGEQSRIPGRLRTRRRQVPTSSRGAAQAALFRG